jgi:hypothetical protein
MKPQPRPCRYNAAGGLAWQLLNIASLLALPLVIRVLLVPWVWLIGAIVLVGLVLRAAFRLVR